MPFNWLSTFYQQTEKPDNYAEKTLAAYRLGIKAGGSIIGVRVEVNPGCCKEAKQIPPDKVYLPDQAPHLPLDDCSHRNHCQCVYRPVMKYEESTE